MDDGNPHSEIAIQPHEMPSPPDIAMLEIQLRLAQSRLDAAQSGLFTTSPDLIQRYRLDVQRLEREIAKARGE